MPLAAPRWRSVRGDSFVEHAHELGATVAGATDTQGEAPKFSVVEDDHGRNMAVLKDIDGSLRLTPVYDFGPSFLDARSIVRVIRWDGEAPDRRDWNHIIGNVATRFEEAGAKFEDWAHRAVLVADFGGVCCVH